MAVLVKYRFFAVNCQAAKNQARFFLNIATSASSTQTTFTAVEGNAL
jgi:hypothetical protein